MSAASGRRIRDESDGANVVPFTLRVDVKDPKATARQMLLACFTRGTWSTLYHWRGEFRRWDGTHFAAAEDLDIARIISERLDTCELFFKTREGPAPAKQHKRTLDEIVHYLKILVPLGDNLVPPFWMPGPDGTVPDDLPQSCDMVACANGLVCRRDGLLWDPTPQFFNIAASPVPYIPGSPRKLWEKLLTQDYWPHDKEHQEAAQEAFGCWVAGDTSHQKLFFIYGPPGCGKSVITGAAAQVVGEDNVCAPTLPSFAERFNTEPLIGKTLALVPEARISKKVDRERATSAILAITGGDLITSDQKHAKQVTTRLRANVVLTSNELPDLADTAGALARRILVLKMTHVFVDEPDTGLAAKLAAELPGILEWAIEGWMRLADRKKFLQPAAAEGILKTFRNFTADTQAFIREACVLDSGARIGKVTLYDGYVAWRKDAGFEDRCVTREHFGRNLFAANSAVSDSSIRSESGKRVPHYLGIRLKKDKELDL